MGFLKTLEKFSQEAVDEGYDQGFPGKKFSQSEFQRLNPKNDGLDFLNALYGTSSECNETGEHEYGDFNHGKVKHIKQKESKELHTYRRKYTNSMMIVNILYVTCIA